MKKIISLIMAFMLVFSMPWITAHADSGDKLKVITTIFAPYDFVREIVGDRAEVSMLLPPASETHSYEPTPQDIIKIQNCDIFIYVGGESDAWVEGVLESMDTSKMRIVTLMDCVEVVQEELVEGMEDDHGHSHGEIDPDNVKDRPMSDFDGSWISGIPLVNDGSFDAYIKHAAEENGITAEEQKAVLLNKWASDYDNITVSDSKLSAGSVEAEYEYKGFSVIESDHGVSVWYKYQMVGSVVSFPAYIAFNDHGDGNTEDSHEDEERDEHEEIAHMHMRYGNEGFDTLMDAEDAPYYFDSGYSAFEIGEFMAGDSHEEEAEYDEHVWTSPRNAQLIVQKISDILCDADASNADAYKANTETYLKKLNDLDAEFNNVVNSAARKTIVFGDRFPFRYFADAYGLEYYAAFPGCSTETEPSAATIKFLIDKVREEAIPVIFHAELSNERMANTIAEETGAKSLLLHACHNISKQDFESGLGYLDLMSRNVDNLKEALN